MASAQRGAALRHIHRLFDEGTLAGLPDSRLLERYAGNRDELAFEALVHRHGAMVMGVCRGVLDDANDADDAFQAAFLVLARKAKSIWIEGSIGGWLHRVAWRIALQVKTDAARRRRQEQKAAELAGTRETCCPPWDDADSVLHQEIDRLPERFRKPIILCYLEDMTCQQAAGYLRWSLGTTRRRLARGKELLRNRLTRRGIALAAGIVAVNVGRTVSAVPTALAHATVRAASHARARRCGDSWGGLDIDGCPDEADRADHDAHQAEDRRGRRARRRRADLCRHGHGRDGVGCSGRTGHHGPPGR